MENKENLLGEIYERSIDKERKKAMGQYYTPDYIIQYIMGKTLANLDVIERPFVKIIDPSCGAGFFLLSAYDILFNHFTSSIDKLKKKNKLKEYKIEINGVEEKIYGDQYWQKKNIHYHILKNCLYGADKDSMAIKLAICQLKNKVVGNQIEKLNILECDSLVYWENLKEADIAGSSNKEEIKDLIRFWSVKFDYVVGNPPYIGHKKLSLAYKKWLLEEYGDVYKDKSDISFCFFKRIKDIMHKDSLCGIISSRYFMESPTGSNLRKYLLEKIKLLEIVDFYGLDIFKGVGVATAIYIFKPQDRQEDYYIDIHKLNENRLQDKKEINIKKISQSKLFDSFTIPIGRLKEDRWLIVPEISYSIYKKIQDKCNLRLGDLVISFQGIITGCDKAFVLNKKQLKDNNIENDIVKPWIKNRNLESYYIEKNDLYLIYSDSISDPELYPNSIKYIEKQKEKLVKRRECKSGIRKWYKLQWGRKEETFEVDKIIFPYKSKTNKFAIDYKNQYFSADIYGFIIKDQYKDIFTLEYLLGLLNSSVYEFYFKLFAKKMGRGIYDYYPNSVMDLGIISEDIIAKIEKRAQDIIKISGNKRELKIEINQIIMDYFNFTQEERRIIEENITI